MPHNVPSHSEILDLVRDENWNAVKAVLPQCHPADIADVIEHAPSAAREHLFSLLSEEVQPDVLSELPSDIEADILRELTPREISEILEGMPPDDAADVIAEVAEHRSEEVLELMQKDESDDVRQLLTYDEDSAGGIMTTDVVAMRGNQTVQEAIDAIAYLDTRDEFYYANIVDAGNRLIGFVDVWNLLREKNKQMKLEDLVQKDFAAATVDMDQEEVAHLMSKYDLTALPVIDEDGKLVGRVTADDVMDVLEEEASEDILRLAGTDDAELEAESAIRSSLVRLPWLFITLLGGFVVTVIMTHFQANVSLVQMSILAGFVPSVLAMCGNTGIQSSTLTVRRIALGDLDGRRVLPLLLREIMVGMIMGIVCGTIISAGAHVIVKLSNSPPPPTVPPYLVGLTVGTALFCAMTFAAMFGSLVPVLLNKARIDPAVASGPFVTIANDISALLIYFGITVTMLHTFLG